MAPRDCLLIVSPHADDEVLGAPSLVIAARAAGWRVVNLLCFLRPAQRERRREEAQRAAAALDIELRVAGEPLLSSAPRSDPEAARAHVADAVARLTAELSPRIVLSPGPHDMHPAHEAVADGVRRALEAAPRPPRPPRPPRWGLWGWWGELAIATTVALYDGAVMAHAQRALAMHRGELERLDLAAALEARARWQAAVGPERVRGPGHVTTAADRAPHADLLLELGRRDGAWWAAAPRVATAGEVLSDPDWTRRDLTPWLESPSPSRLGGGGAQS